MAPRAPHRACRARSAMPTTRAARGAYLPFGNRIECEQGYILPEGVVRRMVESHQRRVSPRGRLDDFADVLVARLEERREPGRDAGPQSVASDVQGIGHRRNVPVRAEQRESALRSHANGSRTDQTGAWLSLPSRLTLPSPFPVCRMCARWVGETRWKWGPSRLFLAPGPRERRG